MNNQMQKELSTTLRMFGYAYIYDMKVEMDKYKYVVTNASGCSRKFGKHCVGFYSMVDYLDNSRFYEFSDGVPAGEIICAMTGGIWHG